MDRGESMVKQRASSQLRRLGAAAILLWLLLLMLGGGKIGTIDANALMPTLLLAGFGLLVAAEVTPLLESLRIGDFEVTLARTAGEALLGLQQRVAMLELTAAAAGTPVALPDAEREPAPARARAQTALDDQWKNRFGGRAEAGGFRLRAEFRNVTSRFVEILMVVEPTSPRDLPPDESVEFHLHQTFHPEIVQAAFLRGRAELSVIAYGGFTVGAWLPRSKIELELDLAPSQGAPRVIRDL